MTRGLLAIAIRPILARRPVSPAIRLLLWLLLTPAASAAAVPDVRVAVDSAAPAAPKALAVERRAVRCARPAPAAAALGATAPVTLARLAAALLRDQVLRDLGLVEVLVRIGGRRRQRRGPRARDAQLRIPDRSERRGPRTARSRRHVDVLVLLELVGGVDRRCALLSETALRRETGLLTTAAPTATATAPAPAAAAGLIAAGRVIGGVERRRLGVDMGCRRFLADVASAASGG